MPRGILSPKMFGFKFPLEYEKEGQIPEGGMEAANELTPNVFPVGTTFPLKL